MGASLPGRNPLCHICDYKIEMLPLDDLPEPLPPHMLDLIMPSKITPQNAKLGTMWRYLKTQKLYQLRQFPITENTNEPRTRYFFNKDTRETVTDLTPSLWEYIPSKG